MSWQASAQAGFGVAGPCAGQHASLQTLRRAEKRVPKTIEEIARGTGLSVTTIRLITNGQATRYRISKSTQQIVGDYIRRYGYVVNHAARSLKLRRTDTIGLVVPAINNAFFARLMAELERLCRGHGLVLLTASTNEDPAQEDLAVRSLWARGVDGLIIAPCQKPDYGRVVGRNARVAIVIIDRPYATSRHAAVASDNFAGCLELTREILEEGGRRTVFLCANPGSPSIADRIRGFSAACLEEGISEWQDLVYRAAEDNVASGAELMDRLLDRDDDVPASFMCSSLLVLEGATQRLKQRVGRIPAQTIMGTFDDHPMLDFLPNRILSVRQDEAALAAAALRRLQEQLGGADTPPSLTTVACELVRRGQPFDTATAGSLVTSATNSKVSARPPPTRAEGRATKRTPGKVYCRPCQ
jgi:LacI family fructose operon transcriptional repressor